MRELQTISLRNGGSVEAFTVGGPEGVFAARRVAHAPDEEGIVTFSIELYAGDDGSWWKIWECNERWISGVIDVLECAIARR